MVMATLSRRPLQLALIAVLILAVALALFGALSRPASASGQSLTPGGATALSLAPHPYCIATMAGC